MVSHLLTKICCREREREALCAKSHSHSICIVLFDACFVRLITFTVVLFFPLSFALYYKNSNASQNLLSFFKEFPENVSYRVMTKLSQYQWDIFHFSCFSDPVEVSATQTSLLASLMKLLSPYFLYLLGPTKRTWTSIQCILPPDAHKIPAPLPTTGPIML